jgi:hypothetical protein
MPQKSLFASKTFWAAVATFWLAIAPQLQQFADQERLPKSSEWVQIVTLLITTGVTIYGRYNADTTLFTPSGLPGRDKPAGEWYQCINSEFCDKS